MNLRLLCSIYTIAAVLQAPLAAAWTIPRGYLGVSSTIARATNPTHRSPAPQDEAPPGWASMSTMTPTHRGGGEANGISHGDDATLARLMGDLESCGNDLLPHNLERLSMSDETLINISGSKVQSCRLAIASLVGWYRLQSAGSGSTILVKETVDKRQEADDSTSRFNLVNPGNNVKPPHESGHPITDADADSEKSRPTTAVKKQPTCSDLACANDDTLKKCVLKKGKKLKPKLAKMCSMCHPRRNEGLIKAHCSDSVKKRWYIFYVLSAILLAVAATCLAVFIRRKVKARAQIIHEAQVTILPIKQSSSLLSIGGSSVSSLLISERIDSWLMKLVSTMRDPKVRTDVEEHSDLSLKPSSTASTLASATGGLHPLKSGAEVFEKQGGLKFRKSCDSGRKVPAAAAAAAQRARSSSVQTLVNGPMVVGTVASPLVVDTIPTVQRVQCLGVSEPQPRPRTTE